MRKSRAIVLPPWRFVLILCLLSLLAASKRPAVISIETSPITINAGKSAEAQITVKVKSGYHVQANPASEEYLIPTKLELKTADGITSGTPVYPKGQHFKLEGSNQNLATYQNSFVIKVPLQADSKAKAGETKLEGTLRYQACDAKSCLFPDSVPVQIPVTVK
jgi:DsbC/DsbD-like thiol-disulfide interchange protein